MYPGGRTDGGSIITQLGSADVELIAIAFEDMAFGNFLNFFDKQVGHRFDQAASQDDAVWTD